MSTRFRRPSETKLQALLRAIRRYKVIARFPDGPMTAKISFSMLKVDISGAASMEKFLKEYDERHNPLWSIVVGEREIPL